MRFGLETARGSGVNVHLLFSPEHDDCTTQIKRFLEQLKFRYKGENYRCCRADLILLGKAHNPSINDEKAALEEGVKQFKISFELLQEEWEKSKWIQKNCLVAVAAGQGDGTSGLRDPSGAFTALRESIESFAHIVFSARPAERTFWFGKGPATTKQIEEKWGSLKPCLHGSDAHQLSDVGMPKEQRFCWIKGDPTFESLRQACIEPEERVYIGPQPPGGSLASHTIKEIYVSNASWMTPSRIALNPGLVAIIGARGSGKTALADLIAAGGFATEAALNPKSFVVRARDHLLSSSTHLTWVNGEITTTDLHHYETSEYADTPNVRYLSQQFVDDLCCNDGLAKSLVSEIQRVIYNAHPIDERLGSENFEELYSLKSESASKRRTYHDGILADIAAALARERLNKSAIRPLTKQREDLERLIAQDEKDQKALIGKEHEVRAKRHQEISDALLTRRREHDAAQLKLRALTGLRDDVERIRTEHAPEVWSTLKHERRATELQESEWESFQLQFIGEVDTLLSSRIHEATKACGAIAGLSPQQTATANVDPTKPLLPNDCKLEEQTIASLQAELSRLGKLIGIDEQNAKKYTALGQKIDNNRKALGKIRTQIVEATGADNRIDALLGKRGKAYEGVFSALVELQDELRQLYSPLEQRLRESGSAVGKLSFTVKRSADIDAWAGKGEDLLDLRKLGPFKGRGSLLMAAKNLLCTPWQHGTAVDVSTAMTRFIEENEAGLREHRPEGTDSLLWSSSVGHWLYSTEHITLSYSIAYDGTDIERLSPGTRGIVLLLLYLAIDREDDRPLIIDQPEENLDPQSVFQELVSQFRDARKRRQIIIVTHNANLVVNTDVDQVIVATAGTHQVNALPQITYETGGLENPRIRQKVCEILEGGERAFRDRAKRLRMEI